jgi:superkiller protein 3
VTLSVHGQRHSNVWNSATELKARGDAAERWWPGDRPPLDTKSARIQDEIGFLLVVLNRRDEALQYFERAVHLEPQFAPAHYHLGVALWLEHKPSQSIPELQAAAALDRENFDYRFLLGNALNDTGNFREALSELSSATTLDAKHSEAWNHLGIARQHTGDAAGAVEAYQRATTLNPSNLDACNNLGVMLVATGRAEEGVAQFEASRDPSNNMARVNVGFAYCRRLSSIKRNDVRDDQSPSGLSHRTL